MTIHSLEARVVPVVSTLCLSPLKKSQTKLGVCVCYIWESSRSWSLLCFEDFSPRVLRFSSLLKINTRRFLRPTWKDQLADGVTKLICSLTLLKQTYTTYAFVLLRLSSRLEKLPINCGGLFLMILIYVFTMLCNNPLFMPAKTFKALYYIILHVNCVIFVVVTCFFYIMT